MEGRTYHRVDMSSQRTPKTTNQLPVTLQLYLC
jgi:hypothetical protein